MKTMTVRRCDTCEALINMGALNIKMDSNGRVRHDTCKPKERIKSQPRKFEMI